MNLKNLPEHQVIKALCLYENADGTPRKNPHKELYKLVTVGQPVSGGRHIKLAAHMIAGKYVVPENALKAFMEATQL